jgi:amino acid transporter
MSDQDEKKKIGVVVATAMSVTIVVGAGLLALPGLSYAHAGRLGYMPWVVVATLMLPLLVIFAYFGKTHPSAGGVVGYVRVSLGHRIATMCEMVVLGTFTLGIPAIALIGAGYLQQYYESMSLTGVALAMVSLAFLAGVVGLRVSGAIQTGIAIAIVVGLVTIGSGYLMTRPVVSAIPAGEVTLQGSWGSIAAAIPVVLFAFTGWEMTAFLAEDMKDPQRDMPTSIWASFIVVTALYLFIAWVVATYATPGDNWRLAPIVQLAKGWMGNIGGQWVALIGALLVIANVVAAFLSASRAIFSAGRDGLLPRVFGKTGRNGDPLRAMVLTYAIFVTVILFAQTGMVKVDLLLQLAGQNFFVLYLLAAIGYTKLNQHNKRRWIGYSAIAGVLCMMLVFSVQGLMYCAALAGLGLWLGRPKRKLAHAGQ